VTVTTVDSYFVLDGGSRSAHRGQVLVLENFRPSHTMMMMMIATVTYLRFYVHICFLAMAGHRSSCWAPVILVISSDNNAVNYFIFETLLCIGQYEQWPVTDSTW